MKIGILSDIHGNDFALRAVLEAAKREGIERLLICGDFIGYYYNIHKVLDLLNNWHWEACRGNHEDLFKEWITGNEDTRLLITTKYGSSFKFALENLTTSQIDFLTTLPHPNTCSIDNIRFLICHGSPWDISKYIYPNSIEDEIAYFKKYLKDFDVIIFGHTHYQLSWSGQFKLIINPGSVGQPRSGNTRIEDGYARSEWGIFNTITKLYEPQLILYKIDELTDQINLYDPNLPFLKNVLLRR